MPATPALGPALRRLHQPPGVGQAATPADRRLDWLDRAVPLAASADRQLALIGRTPEQYALSMLLSGGRAGRADPARRMLFAARRPAPGVRAGARQPRPGALAPFSRTAWCSTKADGPGDEFRQAVCTYLDLVALQLSAAHGPVQSLERAAAVCDGWVFDRIQESLRIAQMQMHSPWDELRDLAENIGIPELGDVGAIMRSSGSEGAQVHETLRSRADSLRDQIRTDNLARAEGVTSRLDIPGRTARLRAARLRPLSVHRPPRDPAPRRSTPCPSSPTCTSR